MHPAVVEFPYLRCREPVALEYGIHYVVIVGALEGKDAVVVHFDASVYVFKVCSQ